MDEFANRPTQKDEAGQLISVPVRHEETGKLLFTVSASLGNEENRSAAEHLMHEEAHRRLQTNDWIQDEHYILGGL